MRIHTTHTRDAALRELNRITRWLIAGSVVLTGVLSDVAASAFSGKRTVRRHTAGASSHATRRPQGHTPQKTPTSPLRPPAQAPSATGESHTSQESPPAQEPAPQTQQPAPAQESAPAAEPAPAHEAAPEPAPESSGPVGSGGS